MKALSAIIGLVVGILLTALACSWLNSAHESRQQVQLLSNVYYPLKQNLDDIVQTHDHGDAALAERKTRLLQQRWSEFIKKSGRPPEEFSSEIINLSAPTTQLSP